MTLPDDFNFAPEDVTKVVADRSGEVDNDLEVLLVVAEQVWTIENSRINVTQALDLCASIPYDITESRVLKVLSSSTFKKRMDAKGIWWPDNWNDTTSEVARSLTPQQLAAVSVITDPTRREPLKDRLLAVGVTYAQYRNWLRNPVFKSALTKVGEELLTDSMASVHNSLTMRAMAGDTAAIKMFYEVSGRHDPNKQQLQDLGQIINLILEVITRRITDVGTVRNITNDIDLVLSGGKLEPLEIQAHNPNIEDAVIVPDADIAVADGWFDFNPEEDNG